MKINSVEIPNDAKIYLCGPTVYQDIHIGNLRSMLLTDVIVRALDDPFFVRNITDIDDKIIDLTDDIYTFTSDIIKQFHHDANIIALVTPTVEPRATDYIATIISIIEKLVEKEYAYISDNHVLFDTRKYLQYGKVSNKNIDQTKQNVRKIINTSMKYNEHDFVLWKPDKNFWNSPWGKGRPGWHIECSAMIYEIFKGPIDLHCGGVDLKFPHHENENAQSCCAFNYQNLSKAWFHNEMLTINNTKMSKSQGNVIKVKDVLQKHHATTVRIALLNTIYYKKLDWNDHVIEQSKILANKIHRFLFYAHTTKFERVNSDALEAVHNNLNTPLALQLLVNDIKLYFQGKVHVNQIFSVLDVLGILDTYQNDRKNIDIEHINFKHKEYIQYKEKKDYSSADQIKTELSYIEINEKEWYLLAR